MQASRFFGWLSVALAVCVTAACGDDTGSGGAGGSGGEPSTTTSSTTSAKSSTSTTTTGSSTSTSTTNTTNTTTTTSSTGGGGMAEGGGGGDGGGGGMQGNPSQQIADVLATADGGGLTLPIQGALVTYTKPVLGLDPAGFFLQADQAGPAIFVAVDPATLSPVPVVGDEVDLTVTDVVTNTGLKQITGITGFSVVSSGNSITPLVADVNNAADLVSNLDAYTSRVITLDADIDLDFTTAGNPQVAAKITTMGVDDPDLRIRMPEAVRATYDLQPGCAVTLDYGVMWRFNAVAQPSALQASDLTIVLCPAPTVVSAIALSSTSVLVTFDRTLDAATVQAGDFTFNNGLTAQGVMVNGNEVTVTTSAQAGGTYTVTAANLDDVLGSPVGSPNSAMFSGFVTGATMLINEVNANISGSTDLVELLVTGAGTTNGITLGQESNTVTTLATFPDVNVAVGDLIVVHLNPAAATGAAPGSETTSKNQHANASFSANYDNAWDFHGTGTTGLVFSNRILRIDGPGSVIIDAIPVVLTGQSPMAFPADLQALQGLGLWLPANCGGMLCDYASTPTAIDISVNYFGSGNSATGNSIQRKPGFDTMQASDWNAAAAHSWGQPNP